MRDVSIAQICNYKQALIARLIDPNALPTRKWLAEWNKRMDFQDRQYAMHDKLCTLDRTLLTKMTGRRPLIDCCANFLTVARA